MRVGRYAFSTVEARDRTIYDTVVAIARKYHRIYEDVQLSRNLNTAPNKFASNLVDLDESDNSFLRLWRYLR